MSDKQRFEPLTVEKLHAELTWPLALLRAVAEQIEETNGTESEWSAMLTVLDRFGRMVERMRGRVMNKKLAAVIAPEPKAAPGDLFDRAPVSTYAKGEWD